MQLRHIATLALSGIFAVLGSTACNNTDAPGLSTHSRVRQSATLRQFNSCDDLARALRDGVREEARTYLLQSLEQNYYNSRGIDDVAPAPEAAASDTEGGRTEGVDFSGTNNQEQGVDEADFVKTDGYFHYVLNDNRLEIFSIPQFGEIVHASSSLLEGYPQEMLLGQDRVAVFSSVYTWDLPEGHPIRKEVGAEDTTNGYWYYPATTLTKITVLDVTDRSKPSVLRELYLEGWYQTAREVQDTVRFVNHSWMQIRGVKTWPQLPNAYYESNDPVSQKAILRSAVVQTLAQNDTVLDRTPLEDFLPIILERRNGSITRHPFTQQQCSDFSIPKDGVGRGITSILSLDLLHDGFRYDADHIVSNWATVYASTDTLVVAEVAQSDWWYWGQDNYEEATNFHRFDISKSGETHYTGSGRVPGLIRGQFAMSEHNGMLRVATTTGRWWWWEAQSQDMENHVYVMEDTEDGPLQVIGHVGGIGVGEQLWSVRFVGEEAFVVTFRQIDPLWTIDLSNPTSPRIRGELEIPGVSTYIHPTDGNHLLTIGYGGDGAGLDWNTQISLFDITDRETPTQQSALSLAPPVNPDNGWSWAWSEAAHQHKAFQYWAPQELLAIPLSSYRYTRSGYYEYNSGLELLRVSMTDGLSHYASIDHSGFFNTGGDYRWNIRDVRRSFFMGDYIYAFSDRGVTIHDLNTMTLMDAVPLPGTRYSQWWRYD